MNPEYKRHAYAHAILGELRRHLTDRFTSADGPTKGTLICEQVYYADRFVPQDAVHEMLDRIQRLEEEERQHMASFVTLPRAQLQPTTSKEVESEPKGQERRKRKAAGE